MRAVEFRSYFFFAFRLLRGLLGMSQRFLRMLQRFLGMLKRFLRVGIVASFYGFFQMRDGFLLVRDAFLGMLDRFLDMPIFSREYGDSSRLLREDHRQRLRQRRLSLGS